MRHLAAFAMLVLSLPGLAQAQDFIREDCRTFISSPGAPFDTPDHLRWYRRFWSGDCGHMVFCISGSPNWNDIVGKLVARVGPAERPALLPKACRLGQLIGFEWARDRKTRRITTKDLRTFKTTLEASGDASRGLDQVEIATRAKLAQ
jgi:hypothetical protein